MKVKRPQETSCSTETWVDLPFGRRGAALFRGRRRHVSGSRSIDGDCRLPCLFAARKPGRSAPYRNDDSQALVARLRWSMLVLIPLQIADPSRPSGVQENADNTSDVQPSSSVSSHDPGAWITGPAASIFSNRARGVSALSRVRLAPDRRHEDHAATSSSRVALRVFPFEMESTVRALQSQEATCTRILITASNTPPGSVGCLDLSAGCEGRRRTRQRQ